MGTLLQWGGANADWVQASGGTYNLVEKIDTIISTIQGQLPAEIIFTTTSTDPPQSQLVSIVSPLRQVVQVPQVLLLLLLPQLVSTKEEAEAAVGR